MEMGEPLNHARQLFDLTGRTAIVTGGAGYLGSAIAEALAELGASVVITSRDANKASAAAAGLPVSGSARHAGLGYDQSIPQSAASCIDAASRLAGPVSVLVNNAHDRTTSDWTSVTPEEFARDLGNVTSAFSLARAFHSHVLQRAGEGSVINVGSMYSLVGSYPEVYQGTAASPVSYHAAKGAIAQLTRHLAVYWAKDRVRVNCLCPGPFPFPNADDALVERLNHRVPMGRVGAVWEVKGAAAFLASDASSYVTGQQIVVDGGWTAW